MKHRTRSWTGLLAGTAEPRHRSSAWVLSIGAAAATAAIAVAPASAAPSPSAAPPQPLSDYCRPSANVFNPPDVPPEGSAAVRIPGVRSRSITVDGVRTRLLEAGRSSSRTAVVFLHGSPGSGADFAEFMPQVVANGGRAIAVDGYGYGQAGDAWARPRKVEPAVAFVEDALRSLGVERVHLVAHDVGAGAGLEWGARHPRRLRSVTLIDGGMVFDYRHHDLAQISRSRPGGEAFWFNTNRASFAAGIQNGQDPTKPLPPGFVNRLYDDLDRGTRCSIIALYRQNEESEIRSLARSQAAVLSRWRTRPALVLWGKRDPYLPVKHAFQQRRGLPAAQVEIFGRSGHWPFADSPERTRRLLVPFLLRAQAEDRSQPGGGSGGARNGTSGDDVLVGTSGDDTIRCGAGNDRVDGRGGNDVIDCGAGDDIIVGGSGDDRLFGGSGDDRIDGGSGDDRLVGGPGEDRLESGSGRDSISQ